MSDQPPVDTTSSPSQPADMAHHQSGPSDDIAYDPLPLTNEHGEITLHDPLPQTPTFHTPNLDPRDLPDAPTPELLPPGAGQPRFLGKALYDEGSPHPRDSWASSHKTFPSNGGGGSEYDSSIYALNQHTPGYGSYRDDPRGSDFFLAGTHGSEQALPMSPVGHSRYLEEKRDTYLPPAPKSKRKVLIWGGLAGLSLLIIAIIVPLYFTVLKKHGSNGSGSSGSGNAANPTSTSSSGSLAVVTGGDGSKVTTSDGTTFTYQNSFGGTWYWDPNDPFNNGAQAQSWTPALNQTFQYGVDKIRGVNLGGWLNTEPFMQVALSHVPALYEKYVNTSTPAVDEWTLSVNMAADTANGGLNQLEEHYKTFITEEDFAQIAGAGLNFVRIPLPYWAIETRAGEPFLAKTAWTYFLKAIQWARKYGIRINVDLHALPGSQNGWNHSGKLGTINVLNGPMGLANAQRSLDYIRIIAEFISQPEYRDVVPLFGITNEPEAPVMGQQVLSSYYLQAYNYVREAGGTGQGNGPYVSFHDGFLSEPQWAGFLPNADRISLDTHPYLCFGGQSDADMSTYATTPCSAWGANINGSMAAFGLTTAGEWSNAVTDCGLWVNGVNQGTRYEGTYAGSGGAVGSCTPWTDWQNYTPQMKSSIQQFALASMDALQNSFFWTWKIGNSSVSGVVESPAWSYQLGLQNGWMPTDPRQSMGKCGNTNPWNGPLQPYQTGGAGAGQIPASVTQSLAWPPATISGGGAANLLPTYTPTGVVPTLPAPTFTNTKSATISAGDGWENSADTAGLMVNIASCSYLNPWIGSAAPPSPLCSGAAAKREVPVPTITPAP